jgi:hypothetical protein
LPEVKVKFSFYVKECYLYSFQNDGSKRILPGVVEKSLTLLYLKKEITDVTLVVNR